MHREGLRWCQLQPCDLLAHLPRDARNGGRHVGHHALSCLETLQAGLAEPFLRRHGAHRVDVALAIPGHALPVATHAARHIDTVVGVADGAETLDDLIALCAEALGLVTCCVPLVFDRLQARDALRGTARATRCQLVVGPVEVLVPPRERLCRLGDRPMGRPLCDGHRSGDRLAQCMLPREESGE
jgi:hypothetical protein